MPPAPPFLPQGYGFTLVCAAAFWLLLALPGYTLLRRAWPHALDGGAASALALSYLASFALAVPLCALGYAFRLPVTLLSSSIVLAVVFCSLMLWRGRRALRRPRLSLPAAIASAMIAFDLVLALHSGSNPGGDGRYHIARVRMLLVHGFNSWDPLVPGRRFDDVYHSNVYHALIAASAQLLGVQAPMAWAFAWFFAKLAACAAAYHLAWTVLADRFLAWTSAAVFALYMAPDSTLAYPNTLALYWLIALGAAFVVEAVRTERGPWAASGLAATALVLPQVHGLYYVFACLVLGPVLLVACLRERLRTPRPASHRWLLGATLALACGLPWFMVGHFHRASPVEQAKVAAVSDSDTQAGQEANLTRAQLDELPAYARARASRNRGFVDLGGGRMMFDLRSQLDWQSSQLQLLVITLVGLWLSPRRRELRPILAMTALVAVMLYVPFVCTALIRAAGAPWIVRRLSAVPEVLHLALVPALLLSLLLQRSRHPAVQAACFAAAMGYAYAQGIDSGAWTRKTYLRRGLDGKAQYATLRGHARKRAFFLRTIPRGAIVAVDPSRSGELVVDCDCYPLALGLDQSSHGLRDPDRRRASAALVLGRAADLSTRVAILRRYRVDRLYVRSPGEMRMLSRIYRSVLARTEVSGKERVLELDLGRAALPQRAASVDRPD